MAKKLESSLKNMVISLTLISLIASAAVGEVFEITKVPRELASLQKKINAITQVVPAFDNNPFDEALRIPTGEGDSLDVYPAKMNGNIVGYAVNTYTNNGFSGDILLMAGFKADGTIHDIAVLEHAETPGLGSKISDPNFKNQFKDMNLAGIVLKVKQDGGQVDAITAATISARAFCEAVQRAYNTLEKGDLK
jgi:electron transport complex protein RnfG